MSPSINQKKVLAIRHGRFLSLMALHRNTPKMSNYVITLSAETKALLPGLTYNATSTVSETVGKILKKNCS